MEIALIGNPNCGKTSLFNLLVGAHQKVGNWTGVTVEKKSGVYKKDKTVKVVDLPGVYSLSAVQDDERAVKAYLEEKSADCIINVVDGRNLKRNLYLTRELTSLNIPVVLAINFSDVLDKKGIKINAKKLSEELNVPVILISASKKRNIDQAVKECLTAKLPNKKDFNIDRVFGICVKSGENKNFSVKTDDFLTNKFLALPVFFLIIFSVYFVSLKVGGFFGDKISDAFINAGENLGGFLSGKNCPIIITDFIVQAVFHGVGGVVSFMPQVLLLFFLLALLEDSGYMARIAFIFHGITCKIGLTGKSVIPIVLSSGCAVTGVLSSKTIEDYNAKKLTVTLSPFMPCGAKTVVFCWFSKVFFNGSPLVAVTMYLISVLTVFITGYLIKKFINVKNKNGFIMEIPDYSFPKVRNVWFSVIEKTKDYLFKAGSTVFAVSVVFWFFKSFGFSGYVGREIEKSFVYNIGNVLRYAFIPLGFDSWQSAVAILSGVFAKEGIVGIFEMIGSVNTVFKNSLSVFSFMIFVLLSPPCVATLVCARKQLKTKTEFLIMIIIQFITAYSVSLIINFIGNMIIYKQNLLFCFFVVIMIIVLTSCSLKRAFNGCALCKGEGLCRKTGKLNTTLCVKRTGRKKTL